ncbi:MAG: phosphate signaling complex protein PhoU [Burkholderiaceae bacterium]
MLKEHTTTAFDADIDTMRSVIITMGGLVEKQFTRSVDAVRYGDLRLITQVLTDEETVNQLHLQTDMLCNQILARRQPFAVDLRAVLAAIHTVNDLERVGDEAKKIALKARDMEASAQRLGLPVESIYPIAEDVRKMLAQALDAFVRHDTSVAAVLARSDEAVDLQRSELRKALMGWMAGTPEAPRSSEAVSAALDLIFVVQSIERVGDHAKNIAEYVVKVVEGVDLRHASSRAAAQMSRA